MMTTTAPYYAVQAADNGHRVEVEGNGRGFFVLACADCDRHAEAVGTVREAHDEARVALHQNPED